MAITSLCVRAATVAMVLSAGAARAEVTAAEVWQDWKGLLESYGQSVTTGSEEQAGGTLTVRNIALNMDLPEGGVTASIEEMVFTEQGDGTVRITMSPEYRMLVSATEAGETAEIAMTVVQSGFEMLASGDAMKKDYAFAADTLSVGVAELAVGDEPLPMDVELAAENVEGVYSIATDGDRRELTSTANLASATMKIAASNPDTDGKFQLNATFADVVSTGSGTLVGVLDMGDFARALESGFSSHNAISFGATSFDFAFDEAGEAMKGGGSVTGGSFDMALLAESLSYATRSTGFTMKLSGSSIPLPDVEFAAEETAFRLAMPIAATAEPREFALLSAYRGLTVSDGIWALFDPGAVLPRDPANVVLDLAGHARWLVDIMAPDAAIGGAMPAEVSDLTLNALELKLAGAELTGAGDFTFDNTDFATYGGLPKAVGSVDLMLVGGNGLLDRLIELGVLPEDQAMGMRMMMGIFARPGDGEDTLVSTIEMNEAGEILANGQRIK